jgi:predicted DsbA family dithiol-disulfide isomerase
MHLLRHARDLGLDVARFDADLQGGRFAARVGQDVNSAEEAGVAGTPTFFVNEVRYRGPHDAASIGAFLDRAGRMIDGRARLAESEA